MKNTFKSYVAMPIDFTMTDEPAPNVICAAECYIADFIEEKNLTNKFFGKLTNKALAIKVSINSSHLRITGVFDASVKNLQEEIEAQMNFIAYHIIRAELQYSEIPHVHSKIFFPGKIPHMFYKRNIYMEALDFAPDNYGVNFVSADDHRRSNWETQFLQHGFDDRETWNMSMLFIEWLYAHLKRYAEVTIVDTEAEKYTFTILDEENVPREVSMTMNEASNIILDACANYLKHGDSHVQDEYFFAKKRMTYALRIWAEIFPAFWW